MIDGFAIGPLYIRFYGILLMLGALAGGFLATIEVKRRGHDPEMVWDLLVYLIIGGVIGARLWHIFTPPPSSIAQGFTTAYYLTHPLDAISIWKGGLGIPGTIIGGLVAMYLYARAHREISFLEWADIAAPSLALGQAIGRWGNFFNQELYGAPTDLPWKIFIDPAHRLAGYQNVAFYHPLFAYESILNVANMLLLLWILRKFSGSLKRGEVFNVYLIVYPVIRFGLDFLRLDASQLFNLDINQALSGAIAVCAVIFLLWRRRSTSVSEAPKGARAVEAVSANMPADSAAMALPASSPQRAPRKAAPPRRPARKAALRRRTAKKAATTRSSATKRAKRT